VAWSGNLGEAGAEASMSDRESARPEPPATPGAESPAADAVVRQFVEHWGVMARSWGINATMGELFALLYVTGRDWTADDLRQHLRISRGNVSMNLRELIAWGVVHKVHRRGERREFYRAEPDVWTLFRRILQERKRRELDPTLRVLDKAEARIAGEPALGVVRERVESLRRFFGLVNAVAVRVLGFEPQEFDDLLAFFDQESGASPGR
jgi:DNA-binding transcriptional regulator GbsR (MarR family)